MNTLLSAAEFRVKHYRIDIEELNKPWYLRFFNDTHSFAALHAENNWNRWIEHSKELERVNDRRVLYFGLGDYLEAISDTERETLIKAGLTLHMDEGISINDAHVWQAKQYADQIAFMKGSIFGLLEGNHHAVLKLDNPSGEGELKQTSTQFICERLGASYLSAMTFSQISFFYKDMVAPVKIYACHSSGGGGGYLLGSQLNMIQRKLVQAWADIYVEAHTHKIVSGVNTILRLEEIDGKLELVASDQILCRTGGMLKSVQKNKPGYIPKKGKGTVPLRLATIKMTPRYGDSLRRGFYIELNCTI